MVGKESLLKLIYVVIDGMGDLPIKELGGKTPLEAADTPNMDFLAKHGKTGLMYTVGKGFAPESDVAVISILGYDPFKYSTGRGVLEAVGANVSVRDGDLALRCNFATLDENGNIIDRRVGRTLTTAEAAELSRAVNEKVKLESHPATFEFKNTIGHRAVLVIRSMEQPLSSKITNTDPAYSRVGELGASKLEVEMGLHKCEPMEESEAARVSADLVNEFTEKSRVVLEEHEINKRRTAEGRLKANVILTRDAAHRLPRFFNINEKYNASFACFADMPVEKGISKLAGMHLIDLPPPSGDLKSDCVLRVKKLLNELPSYDCFYIHLKGTDEPAHDGDFRLKKKLIAIVDQHFFGNLLPNIELDKFVVCVTADHSTPCKLKTHSDDPVPLLISGDMIESDEVQVFSESACRRGSLGILEHGVELMPKLLALLKSHG